MVKVANPADDVQFNIDWDESEKPTLDAVSDQAMGGTELMQKWLFAELDTRAPGLRDKFQFIMTRVRELKDDKQRILWIHDLAGDPEVQHLKELENLKKFEKIVFVSHWQQFCFEVFLGLPPDRGVVIQNAIHPIPEHKKPKSDKINVCYFSTPHRGLSVLLEAWEYMQNELKLGLNAELNIYSSFQLYDRPHMDEQFRHIYKKARDTEGVHYHGTVNNAEIRTMLEQQHIMAYPSIYQETSCITAIEAMSAGCLCVVPNLGALPETCANFAWMYGMEQDSNKHMQVHAHILGRAIQHFWDDDVQNLLKIQKNYTNMFYSWELRTGQWIQFLKAIYEEEEPQTESTEVIEPEDQEVIDVGSSALSSGHNEQI